MKLQKLFKRILLSGLSLGIITGLMGCPRPSVDPLTGLPTSSATNFALILSPSNNKLLVFNLLTHRVDFEKSVGNLPQDIAVSGDSQRVLVTNFNDGTISAFERQSGERLVERGTLSVGPQPAGVEFNRQGTLAFVSTAGNGSIVMLNTAQTSQQPSIVATRRIQTSATTPKTPAPGRIAVSPDGLSVFVVDTANNAVVRFSVQGNTLTQNQAWLAPANAPFELRDIAISNRGELFVVNAANDEIIVFDANNIQTEKSHVSLKDSQFPVINPTNLALNNRQNKLYVTESSANAVGMISLAAAPLQGNISIAQVGKNIAMNNALTSDRIATNPIGIDTTSNDSSVYVSNGGNFNISLLDGVRDEPKRNFATSTSLGTSVPLGKIVIVSISTTTATTRTQSDDSEKEADSGAAPTLPDLNESLRF